MTVATGLRSTNGGQTTASTASVTDLSTASRSSICCARTAASPGVLYIFQFPAIIGLRPI